jgi:signal peptidase I
MSTASPSDKSFMDGWGWLVLASAARAYLFFLLSIAAMAILPALLGWQSSVVQSGSMMPHISPGDVAVTQTLPDENPVPLGRVVSFRSPAEAEASGEERIRLHRIVAAAPDGTFTTRGDANAESDSTPLTRELIIGQARLLVPYAGLPSLWMAHGDFLSLSLWAAGTTLALVLCVMEIGRRHEGAEPRTPRHRRRTRSAVPAVTAAGAVLALAIGGWAVAAPTTAHAAFTAKSATGANTWKVKAFPTISLGRAASYAAFGATSVSASDNSGFGTSVSGSVGVSPGTTISNLYFWNVSGSVDVNNTAAKNAKTDILVLRDALAARTKTATVSPSLQGTLKPGVYASTTGAFTPTGTLTLDADGDPSARFIFTASSLTTAANSVIRLTDGASAANVYWKIDGAASLGSPSTAVGTIIATGNATMQRGAALSGRLISTGGSVTLVRATIDRP